MAYACQKTKGIHHVCLRVPDLLETAKFYQEALGATFVCEWGPDGADDHGILLDLGQGDVLEIFGNRPDLTDGSWQHLAVYTQDIDASYRRAIDCGAKPHQEPRYSEIPTRAGELVKMGYAFVRAPGGELLEFIQDHMDHQ